MSSIQSVWTVAQIRECFWDESCFDIIIDKRIKTKDNTQDTHLRVNASCQTVQSCQEESSFFKEITDSKQISE